MGLTATWRRSVVKDNWIPILVLPNVNLTEPIEGQLAALVPPNDPRVEGYAKLHPYFARFREKFTDTFGRTIRPSMLLVHHKAPQIISTAEALASFRDLIALSVIPYNRAYELLYPHQHRIAYSNTFSFYPWSVARDEGSLIALTPAMGAMDDVENFRGQSSPDVSCMSLTHADIDMPLLSELLRCWRRRYVGRSRWKERALFRSLNMAYQAAQTPAVIATTIFDVGRSLALWVSAFEILAHPRIGRSGLKPVYALLEKVTWEIKSCSLNRYCAYDSDSGSKKSRRKVMACWIYGQIHQARNAFLHGNPVSIGRLFLKGSDCPLEHYAAPLYRLALTAFLPVSFRRKIPETSQARSLGHYIADRMEFTSYQDVIEHALAVRKSRRP